LANVKRIAKLPTLSGGLMRSRYIRASPDVAKTAVQFAGEEAAIIAELAAMAGGTDGRLAI
jgi:hypothetical protein